MKEKHTLNSFDCARIAKITTRSLSDLRNDLVLPGAHLTINRATGRVELEALGRVSGTSWGNLHDAIMRAFSPSEEGEDEGETP